MKLLKHYKINRRVIVAAPFTENLIGENALKPSEIVTMYNGKTVEITNTDAEGRLILADAIAYVIDKFKPEFLIDVATLTGACMVALGDKYAGIMGNNDGIMKKLQKAGDEVDELLWPLPMHRDYNEHLKGVYADLRNSDTGHSMYAGASKGAAFLKEFVGKTPWVHIDIASPAFTSDPKKYEQKGATGFGVRVLMRFLENLGD
jgi:leucyl aminopeptidase